MAILGGLFPTVGKIRRRRRSRKLLREVWIADRLYMVRPAKKRRRRRS